MYSSFTNICLFYTIIPLHHLICLYSIYTLPSFFISSTLHTTCNSEESIGLMHSQTLISTTTYILQFFLHLSFCIMLLKQREKGLHFCNFHYLTMHVLSQCALHLLVCYLENMLWHLILLCYSLHFQSLNNKCIPIRLRFLPVPQLKLSLTSSFYHEAFSP